MSPSSCRTIGWTVLQWLRRWRAWLAGLAVALGLLAAGGWWRYQITRPDYRLRQGQAALLKDDWETVEELALLLESSGSPDHASLLRGQSYLRRGYLNQAIAAYNAINRDRKDLLAEASLHFGLGFYFHGRLTEAEKLLLHAAAVFPDNLDLRRGLSALYYDRGAMWQALHHLEKWAELADHDGMPYRFMGVIYESLGGDAPAVENYRKALARHLAPNIQEAARLELAELLVKRTEFAEALACLTEAPSGAQTVPRREECRAECLCGLSRYREAKEILTSLRASTAPSPRALRLRAEIHLVDGEEPAAVNLLQSALQLDAHDCACRYKLALLYHKRGLRAEGEEELRLLEQSQRLIKELSDLSHQAVEKPRDAGVRRRLADLCGQLNKPALRQTWLKAAASCPPEATPSSPPR